MKKDKDTDRIIGRKLAAYTASPEKLTFSKVHKNYLRRKRERRRFAFIIMASLLLTLGGIAVSGYFLKPEQEIRSAVKQETSVTASPRPAKVTGHSANNPTPEATAKVEHSSPATASTAEKQEHSGSPEHKDLPAKPHQKPVADLSDPGSNKEPAVHEENSSKGIVASQKKARPEETLSFPVVKKKEAKKQPSFKNTAKNIVPGADTKIALAKKKELSPAKKRAKKKSSAKKEDLDPASFSRAAKAGKGKELLNDEKGTGDDPGPGTATQPTPGDMNAAPARSVMPSEPELASGKKKKDADEQKTEGRDTSDAGTKEQTNKYEIAEQSTVLLAQETDLQTEDLQSVATVSLFPPKNHFFLLSPELSWNSFTTKLGPNSAVQRSDSLSGLGKTTRSGPYRSFSGGITLDYKYKKIGISAGVKYYSLENEASTGQFVRNISSFSRQVKLSAVRVTTVITTMTITPPPIGDTTSKPTVIIKTTKDSSILMIRDTQYVQTGSRSYVIVNGDSVDARSYQNQVRFFTVPLYLNYSFNIWRNKLLVEPQAGVQIGIPIRSYQLVAQDDRSFIYSRNKYPLKNYFFLFDASVKINYRLSRHLLVYFKQGYFLSTKSIYANSYPVKNTLGNVYSSVGISIPLK